MPKPKTTIFENGATLIYQKQNTFDGCHFIIGFRGGSQLDGKYTGLSHLLEHLLFRSPKENLTQNILSNILNYTINQNAYTSKNYIVVDFSAASKNVDIALKNCVDMLSNKKFSTDQIAKEIQVVKQEISLTKDAMNHQPITALDNFILAIDPERGQTSSHDEILGSSKTLGAITPDILTKYVKRYFNTDNLVVSVTTNKSEAEIVGLLNKYVFPKFKEAKDPRFVIGVPEKKLYKPINVLFTLPDPSRTGVDITLLLKDRTGESDNINKEYAYEVIEEYMMNTIGGLLWDKLRTKKQLVYTYGLSHLDLDTVKYKMFTATTNEKNMRTTIKEICSTIKHIGEHGVPEEMFNQVKKALDTQKAAVLQRFKNCSASGNFDDYLTQREFLDYDVVSKYISNAKYEDFNRHITQTYRTANVSLLVDGGFQSNHVYNLIEVENMLGNHAHDEQKEQLNVPRMEFTSPVPNVKDEDAEVIYIPEEYLQNQQAIPVDAEPVKNR